MARDVAELLQVLDLDEIEADRFRGVSPTHGRKRVFGGLVVAQSLVAASRTVPDRAPHSLHAYFVLPGDPTKPIDYAVERIRDGGSFSTRRCVALQAGRMIFASSLSFQRVEEGLDHQVVMPSVPPPESLPSKADLEAHHPELLPEGLRQWFDAERSIEIRPCDVGRYGPGAPPRPAQQVWIKASAPLPDDPAMHRAVLAYLSDLTLIDVALAAHGATLFEPRYSVASLDHALWFHRPFRADDWLLYAQDSPNTAGGRGMARGLVFSRDGRLVASVMQEGLIRLAR